MNRITVGTLLLLMLSVAYLGTASKQPTSRNRSNSSTSARLSTATAQRLTPKLEVVIDGSKTPHLIADTAAIAHFLPAIAPSATNDYAHEQRRVRLIDSLQLSSADRKILDGHLTGLNVRIAAARSRLDSMLHESRVSAAKISSSHVRAETLRIRDLSVEAYRSLNQSLSSAGAAALSARLQQTKASIKIFRNPTEHQR